MRTSHLIRIYSYSRTIPPAWYLLVRHTTRLTSQPGMSTDALPQYTQVTGATPTEGCDRQAPRLSEIPINTHTLVTMTLAMIQVDPMSASPGIYNNMRHETGDLHCRSSLKNRISRKTALGLFMITCTTINSTRPPPHNCTHAVALIIPKTRPVRVILSRQIRSY